MSDKNFVKSASMLAFSTIIAKFIGACYRIPLTNILGAEGMGLYQLVFPVFALLLTLSSGAVPAAISIIISQKKALKQNTDTTFYSCLVALTAIGVIITILLIFLSKPVAMLQANEQIRISYLIIAPAILFVSIISVFRGYFMGTKNMFPPALSQITEGAFKLVFGLIIANFFLEKGLEFAVMGALLGITISEFITLIILYILFDKKEAISTNISFKELKQNTFEIFHVALPLTIGGIIIPLSLFFDSIVIVNMLNINQSVTSATIDYGLFSGTVSPIINLPIMLSLSLGIAVLPLLSEGKIFRDLESIRNKSTMCIKLALIIGVPFLLLFLFLAEEILQFLYPVLSESNIHTATLIMRIEALNVLALAVGQITASILQALGKAISPVKALATCVTIKIVLNIILLPIIGIIGAAIASVICFSLYAIMNITALQNLIGKSESMAKNGSLIALSGVIMSVTVFVMIIILKSSWAIWAIIPLAGIIYIISLLAIGVFTKTELKTLPLSKFWLKINNIFRRNKNAII